MGKIYPERLNRDFRNTEENDKIFEAYMKVLKGPNEADDYITNAFGNMQSIKSIKSELEKAKKSKKDVFNSQTSKTMKNAEFIKKTEKLLKGK